MKNNRKLVIAVALSAIVAGGCGYAWYACATRAALLSTGTSLIGSLYPPLFHEAKLLAKSIVPPRRDSGVRRPELQSLIDQQQPHEFQLQREIRTTEALRVYV